jgi:hypothetical protein
VGGGACVKNKFSVTLLTQHGPGVLVTDVSICRKGRLNTTSIVSPLLHSNAVLLIIIVYFILARAMNVKLDILVGFYVRPKELYI